MIGLFARVHCHKWRPSLWTAYNNTPTERRCECGAVERRGFARNLDPLPWVPGEHPEGARLRSLERG